jgi:hypothetical protein
MLIGRVAIPLILILFGVSFSLAAAEVPAHPTMTWVKRHPRPGAERPSPRMGYECAYGYDPVSRLLVRYGGHNQGGGGEQNSELWTYDLDRDLWDLIEPNDAPPGVCCAQQNVFHDALGRYIRFPAFSASHGWQSLREVWLKDSSVWTFDPAGGSWLDMRPLPAPALRPLRGAAYVPDEEVVVIHGGEGANHGTVLYDLYANTWHELKPGGGPERSVSQPGFTYDAVNRVFVLFGSQFGTDPRTWLFDVAKNEWRVLETATHPPADKSSPILAADTRHGIALASVKGADGLETWALDVAKAQWRRLDVRFDPEQNDEGSNGDRNRVLLYLPDRNLFVLECRTKNEQQIWTFRYADAPQTGPAPRNVRLALRGDNEVVLDWSAPGAGGDWKYNVFRALDSNPGRRQWQLIAKAHDETSFVDRLQDSNVKQPHCYRVAAVDRTGKPGFPSTIARTRPAVITNFTVSIDSQSNVRLQWTNPPADSATQIHVERAPVTVYSTDEARGIRDRLQSASDLAVGRVRQVGRFEREPSAAVDANAAELIQKIDLTTAQSKPIDAPVYERKLPDDEVYSNGKPYRYPVYAYRIVAVNRWGQESGPSPVQFTFPTAVQSVFAKEEGDAATRLRWQPHAAGRYHVYRHNGRYNSSPVVRLTGEPIRECQFLDEAAGRDSRRYEIVAVDSLGQEGAPSQPVWSRREWRKFYLPYIEEWHQ